MFGCAVASANSTLRAMKNIFVKLPGRLMMKQAREVRGGLFLFVV